MAGVSPGTVSRALAGKSVVNPETRDRIQAIAREHGFRPNQMASRLRTQRTGVIGVVIPLGHASRQHVSDPFFMTMFGALADELTERGYDLMLSRVVPGEEDWLDRIVDSGMLDGTIVVGQSDQVAALDRVADRYLPLVVWGSVRADNHHCTIGTDNRLGGYLAARHLIEGGRTQLAFFGDISGPEIADRLAGAQQAVAEAKGVTLTAFRTPLSQEDMGACIESHLAEAGPIDGMPIDGIIAASDVIAMVTLRQLHERGARVPEDVAVVGYDDLALATQTVPRLTTVRQGIAEGARCIVAALMERIGGQAAPSHVLAPELVIRESA